MTSYREKTAAVVVVVRHLAGTTEIQTASHVPHRAMLQLGSRLRRAHDVTAQRDSHGA